MENWHDEAVPEVFTTIIKPEGGGLETEGYKEPGE